MRNLVKSGQVTKVRWRASLHEVGSARMLKGAAPTVCSVLNAHLRADARLCGRSALAVSEVAAVRRRLGQLRLGAAGAHGKPPALGIWAPGARWRQRARRQRRRDGCAWRLPPRSRAHPWVGGGSHSAWPDDRSIYGWCMLVLSKPGMEPPFPRQINACWNTHVRACLRTSAR